MRAPVPDVRSTRTWRPLVAANGGSRVLNGEGSGRRTVTQSRSGCLRSAFKPNLGMSSIACTLWPYDQARAAASQHGAMLRPMQRGGSWHIEGLIWSSL